MDDPSKLIPVEVSYLEQKYPAYQALPNSEKQSFRAAITKKFVKDQAQSKNAYAVIAITKKVDNWFNNKNKQQWEGNPVKIARNYTGARVYNIVEEKTIRDQVDTQQSKDATERLNNWNKIWRELYNSLTPEEQQEYIDKADLWNQQGPDATAHGKKPPPVVSETYKDGLPILYNIDVNGKPVKGDLAKAIWRKYIGIHNQWAAGTTKVRTPWGLMQEKPEEFFAEGMVPENITVKDPEKMHVRDIAACINHIVEMENPKPESDLKPVRFELLAWGNNREMGAANYRQPFVPINQKRRGRKVKATTPFSHGPGEDDEYDEVIHRKSAPRAAAGSGAGKKRGGGQKKKSKSKRGVKRAAEEEEEAQSSDTGNDESGEDRPWNHGEKTFEFDEQSTSAGEDEDVEDQVVGGTVEDGAEDEEDEEEDDTGADFEVGPPSAHIKTYPRAPGKTTAGPGPTKSKGKNVKGKEKVTTEQDLVIGPSRVAPFMLKTSPGRKLKYFRAFSAMSEYQSMITRVEEHLSRDPGHISVLTLSWLTWSYESAYLPEEIHAYAAGRNRLFKWLEETPQTVQGPGAVQLWCLAMGMTLADHFAIHFDCDDHNER
ncbi:hypothetical protein C8Q80DRAFT_1274760 [Daedaleopsis nitida]|nr:hypothetical protein C8Q80DRAFT_1274760 [Daedaleopsis nitida]